LKNILKNYPDLPAALIALAEGLARRGDYSEAVEHYHLLLTGHPEKREEAIAGYQEVLRLCPEQILARSYLGEALLDRGEIEGALQEYSRMVEFDPSVTDQVIKKCRDILKEKPDLALAHFVLGRAYLVKGDFQRAIICAETIVSRDKNSVSAQLLLGEAQARLGLTGRAAVSLLAAQAAEPYNLEIIKKYREVRRRQVSEEIESLKTKLAEDQWKVSLRLDLAKFYWENGDEEGAIRELQLVQKDPARLAAALFLSGNIYRAAGRYDLASSHYRRGLEQASTELARQLRAALGSAHEALGEVKQAIKLYEEILQDELDYGDLKERVKWLKSSSLQSLRQRPLLAVLAFPEREEIVALWGRESRPVSRGGKKEEVNASFGQEHSQAGYDYFSKGMYPAAEEELLLAVQLDRHFGVALNNLGVVLLKEGKLAEARSRLLEASRLDPASAIFANNLGVAEFLLGQPEKAEKLLAKARQADGRTAAIALNLGDLLCAVGEGEEGIKLYRQISDSDPLADLVWRRLPRHSA
jgi:tetratricopeptide (TPR) repeat protein